MRASLQRMAKNARGCGGKCGTASRIPGRAAQEDLCTNRAALAEAVVVGAGTSGGVRSCDRNFHVSSGFAKTGREACGDQRRSVVRRSLFDGAVARTGGRGSGAGAL